MALQNAFGDIALDATLDLIREQNDLLRRLVRMASSLGIMDSNDRQRVTVDSIASTVTLPAVTTVSTVSTVTSATVANNVLVGGIDPRWALLDASRTAYETGIRSKIVFS